MSGDPGRLVEDDFLLEGTKAAIGTTLTAFNGGDPLHDPPALGYPQMLEVEMARRIPLMQQRTRQMNEQVFLNPQSGWGEIKQFMDGVFESYKKQNDAPSIKVPKDEQEALAQMQQMRPVQVDPNLVADIRQKAVKLDQLMKQVDPSTSFWTDPRTKNYADWLNREAGVGTAGFMQSGDQPVEMGVVGRAAYTAWQGIEGIASPAMAMIHGSWDIARQSIQAMGGPDIGPSYPTNYIEAEDGTLVHNGGKAPSMMDGITMLWAAATNQNVEKFAAQAGRAQEWEQANRAGFAGIATSVSRLGGELVGMAPGFGAMGKLGEATMGTLSMRGLQALGTLRLGKTLQQSDRALKIIGAMSKGIGQAAGMAAYEAVSYGRIDGYGAAYTHGLMMAPVLMTLGALGKRAEWFAEHRAGMPAAAARAVAGALEGAGFAGVETVVPDLLPTAWGFIRDPNQETWEAYAKNMLAFSLVKMATGRTTAADPAQMQIRRGIGRAQFAEKVARGEVSPEEVAGAPVPDAAALRELGEVSMRAREAATPQERAAAQERQRQLEAELDVREFGKGPAEESVASAGEIAESIRRGERRPESGDPEIPGNRRIAEELTGGTGPYRTTREGPLGEILQRENDALYRRAEARVRGRSEETVEGKEPGPIEPIADRKPLPEEQMIQAGGREGLEPERDVEAAQARAERRVRESVDPLEDPRFRELPEALQREILDAPSAQVRKEIFASYALERRGRSGEKEARGTPLLEVRDPAQSKGSELLPPVSRRADAGVAEDTPAGRRGAAEGERAELRQGLPEAGSSGAEALREVRERGESDAPRGLRETAPGELALPDVSSGAAPGGVEQRRGQQRGAAGDRAGPQSLQQQPTRQVEPSPDARPTRAMDIYAEMEGRPSQPGFRIPFTAKRIGSKEGDLVRVPIRSGKISGGRNVLGVFKSLENLVRTQEGRDLAVASHEWSHAMHRHATAPSGREFTAAAKAQVKAAVAADPRIAAEMAEMLKDYPGADQMPQWLRWMESWAEWHARNLLGEVGLDAKFPALSGYMRGWLAAPAQARLRDQYQRIQRMLYDYNAQGSEMRVQQSMVNAAAPPNETERAMRPGPLRRLLRKLNKALLDDKADLKASQDRWLEAVGRKPEDVSILEDPARLWDTLAMTSSKVVEHFVMDGVRMPDGSKVPGLKSIMDAVKGREMDFQKFVVSVRNLELFKAGKDVQLPPQDYAKTVEAISARHPDFVDRMVELKRWTDALVDHVAGAGAISQEDAQKIKDAYVVYVPFFRAIQGPAAHGQGRGVAERGTGMSRIKGSTYEIQDPFVALQQVARSMVAKAHQNMVMGALFKMAIGQEAGGLATIVPRTSVPKDLPLRELLDKIEKKVQLEGDAQHELEAVFDALRAADAINPETITLFSQKVIPTGEKAIVAFTPRLNEAEIADLVGRGVHPATLKAANNKLNWLELDTKVYEALMGIDKMPHLPDAMQPMMNWLRAPRDLVRFFATGVAPGFVAANMLRDAMSSPLFDRQGNFRPFGGFVKLIRGAIEYHRNGRMRDLYEELGVKTSSFWTEGRQRALIGEQTSLWQKAQAMADRVQNWFSHPENYIRMAEFKDTYERAIKEGKSEQEARMLALEGGREITVNFARAGIWARVLNQVIPYFNAGLQGQRKLWGQLLQGGADTKGDENKARIQRATILNGIANLTVPATLLWLLNKDEEWYQDLPDWRKIGYFNMKIGGEIISVPKPFEAGTLFASLPEIMLDHTFGTNPASLKRAMLSLAGPYLEGPGSLIPAFIKPVLEVATNTNFFTGRPLTPEWISRANPPTEQATFYTTETAKILSRAIGGILTPTEIEALLGGYTASAAVSGMRMIDEISGLKDHPGIQVNPLQRFFKQQEHGQSSYVDQLYELSLRLDQTEADLSARDLVLKRQVDTAKRRISDLRKSYRAGSISQQEAERRSYEIARPLIEQSQR